MDKRLVVVAIAVGATLITTLLSVFLQGREPSRMTKRLLWIGLAAGVVALVLVAIVLATS